MKWALISLASLVGAVLFAGFCTYMVTGSIDLGLTNFGWGALVAAGILTGGLTILLMALMFKSSESGKDATAYHRKPDEH